MLDEQLIKQAFVALQNSYSPYSKFKVGAALLTKSGKVYLGSNIENCCYPAGNCAERSAFFSAVSSGEREFEKIAIVHDVDTLITPCGICLQVMVELAPDIEIICANNKNNFKNYTLKQLLPHSFTENNLK